MFGVFATLGFVLVLLGIVLKLLRKFAPNAAAHGRLPMEVIQRLSLGPKQGIAVVRIGGKLVAVSVGDGGVNHLFQLDESEAARLALPASMARVENAAASKDFGSIFRGALKTAGLGAVVFALCTASASAAHAQAGGPPSASDLSNIAKQAVTGAKAGKSAAEMVGGLTAPKNGRGGGAGDLGALPGGAAGGTRAP